MDLTLDEGISTAPTMAPGGNGGEVIDLVSDDEPERGDDASTIEKKGVFPPALAHTEALAATKDANGTTSPRRAAKTQSLAPPNTRTGNGHSQGSNPTAPDPKPPSEKTYLHADGTWSCPTCTLNNPAHVRRCQACEGLKPIDESVGWRCELCWEYGSEHGFWMCRNCGAIRKRG